MPEETLIKKRESSQDLLNYSIALNWLKTTFPDDRYGFMEAAKALSEEIERRVTPPEQPDKSEPTSG